MKIYSKFGAQPDVTRPTHFFHKFTNTTNTVAKLSLLKLNVNGIKGRLTPMEFCDLCGMYDIVCLNETKCDVVDMICYLKYGKTWI